MDRNFNKSLKLVLKHEGGFSNHKDDPGGATMKGVTLATFRRYVKADATKDDLRKIPDQQLATVYRRHYWDAVAGAELPDGVDYAVFDFAVNSGTGRAAKFIQDVAGVKQDGKLGPASLGAIRAIPHARLINDLCDKRMTFLKGLKTWGTFGKGWTARVREVRSLALEMAARPTPENPTVVEKTVEVSVEVEKPVVPVAIDKEVKKNTNFWGWFIGLFGTGGVGISWLKDADWQTIITFGGIAVVGALILLVLGPLIVRRVKAIRAEIEA